MDTFENVCCNIRNVKSNYLKCIPSPCLSPSCELNFYLNFDGRNMPVRRFFSREGAIQRGDGQNESIYLQIISSELDSHGSAKTLIDVTASLDRNCLSFAKEKVY